MKVTGGSSNGIYSVSAASSNSLVGKIEKSQKNISKTGESKQDRMSFSSTSTSMREMDKKVKDISLEIESKNSKERIQDLKSQIENGTYFVNSGNVADAILGRFGV